jgi:hypothetical protein
MLTRLFLNSKKSLYWSIIIFGILAILTFLFTIKPNKKLFNINLINSAKSLYLEHLKTNSTHKSLKNEIFIKKEYVFPFSLEIIEKDESPIFIDYCDALNKLIINKSKFSDEEFRDLLNILQKFSVFEMSSSSTFVNSTLLEDNAIFMPKFFKHINLYLLVHEEDNLLEYNKVILEKLKNFNTNLNIYVKFLFYDKYGGVINRETFYEDLKTYNSKIIFEELQDENYMNIIIFNQSEKDVDKMYSYYNKVLKHDIWSFNINNLSDKTFSKLINIAYIPHGIRNLIKNEEDLITILKIVNSCPFQYSNLLSYTFNKIEKINKIFSLYETIRTNEKVKEKVFFI